MTQTQTIDHELLAAHFLDAHQSQENEPVVWKRNADGKTVTRRIRVLEPGFAWNPLKKWPPNAPCFCGKPDKAKKCCLPKVRLTIPEAMLAQVASVVEQVKEKFR